MSAQIRIFASFVNTDERQRVRLNTMGTYVDLVRLGVTLIEGLHVVLYCDEFEAEGVVTQSDLEQLWVAVIDWERVRLITPSSGTQTPDGSA